MFCLVHLVLVCRGQLFADGLQQVAQTQHVRGADGNRVAQPQLVELIDVVIHADVVNLVDNKQDGLLRLAQQVGNFAVVVGQPIAAISKEADNIRRIHGDFGLAAHLGEQHIVAVRVNAAGVDEREAAVLPLHISIDAVAGHAGGILHNGDALSGDSVEKSGFADVGAANDGNKRLRHKDKFLLYRK